MGRCRTKGLLDDANDTLVAFLETSECPMTLVVEGASTLAPAPISHRVATDRVAAGRPPIWVFLLAVDVLALAPPIMVWSTGRWGVALVAMVVVALGLRGHYRIPIALSRAVRVGDVAACVVVPLGLLIAVQGSVLAVHPGVAVAAVSLPLLVVARACWWAGVRAWRIAGRLREPILIVGAGRIGVELARVLDDHPEYGLCPIGFLDSFDEEDLRLPFLGRADDLAEVLRSHPGVRRIVIAFGATREPDMVTILRACDQADVEVYVVPRFFELGHVAKDRDVEIIWGLPLRRLRQAATRTRGRRLKRAFDIAASGLAIACAAPILAVIAVAVRLTSPGPALFHQRRVGQLGAPIDVLKFRTLRVNDRSDTQWSVTSDNHVTTVGRVLRRTSLDELPQLFNVFRGDMSLVGPRPERPHFVSQFIGEVPRYGDRHRVPVGMTGLAQVHGLRGDTSIDQRARMDNHYIENWSLGGDLGILSRTALAVVRAARRPQ